MIAESLLNPSLERVVQNSEVIVIGTRGVDRRILSKLLHPSQIVIDLVNPEKSRRPQNSATYDGICW
jgi:hypothetical protein